MKPLVYTRRKPNEMFSDDALATLREMYGKIDTIDPCADSYTRLCALLDAMTDPVLQQIADANIKFMSLLAANRVAKRVVALEEQAARYLYEQGIGA